MPGEVGVDIEVVQLAIGFGEISKQAFKPILAQAEKPLVLPERIVGVETDDREFCAISQGICPFLSAFIAYMLHLTTHGQGTA